MLEGLWLCYTVLHNPFLSLDCARVEGGGMTFSYLATLIKVADRFNIPKRFVDYDDLLKDPEIDAVHINSPIQDHASQSLKVKYVHTSKDAT